MRALDQWRTFVTLLGGGPPPSALFLDVGWDSRCLLLIKMVNLGALMITNTSLGVPYCKYSIMNHKTLF